jgi:hypothetical protein
MDTWLLILIAFAVSGAALLSTDIGRQALVDERVRVIESFGGTVDDRFYAALQAHPPTWIYLASGGRLLLTPAATLLVAAACWAIARTDNRAVTFKQALSIVVHASVVLAIGQIVATPINYVRESLTSPLNLAAVFPLADEGTVVSRIFGAIDLFVVWWMALLAMGLSALTRRRARKYALSLAAVYVGFAAVIAGVITAAGGS